MAPAACSAREGSRHCAFRQVLSQKGIFSARPQRQIDIRLSRRSGVPSSAVDYFVHPTRYDTAETTTTLGSGGIVCPSFHSYAAGGT